MTFHFDPDCCTWDEDGNPDVCLGPPKEEPDCFDCCDTGTVPIDRDNLDSARRPCPNCDPTREDLVAARARYEELLAAGGITDEPPF